MKKDNLIQFKVDKVVLAAAQKLAAEYGMTTGQYCRFLLLQVVNRDS